MSTQPRRRCAIYTRKSTTHGLEQEFNSLDAQRESCESYIRAQASLGWEQVSTYEDGGFSGASIERPGFQRLLADIDAGKVDIVVVYKVDRLSRSLLDFARVMERFNQHNAAFVSVTQNFSTADAMGRLTLNILMSFAEFEREMISERTRDKVQAARKKGRWTGGNVPLGYDVKDSKLVVNDLEAKRRPTKQHVSQHGRVRKPKPWDKDAVLRVLKNPVYAGLMLCGTERYEGEQAAVIDRETFGRVQALLGEKHRDLEVAPSRYLLKGLIRCSSCAGAMSPASTRKKEREYRYYRCHAREKRGQEVCPGRPLPADLIEEFVVARLGAMAASPCFAAEVQGAFEQQSAKLEEGLLKERRMLPGSIAGLSAEAGRLAAGMATLSGVARQGLEAQLQGVVGSLGQQERRLAQAEHDLASLQNRRTDLAWATRMLGDFGGLWPLLSADMQQRLLQVLVERVEVDRATGKVTTVLADVSGAMAPRATGPAMEVSP